MNSTFLPVIGTNPTCYRYSSKYIVIILGKSPSVLPWDVFSLTPGKVQFSSSCTATISTYMFTWVNPPSQTLLPSLQLIAPSSPIITCAETSIIVGRLTNIDSMGLKRLVWKVADSDPYLTPSELTEVQAVID